MESTDPQFDIKITVAENLVSIFASGIYSLIKANNLFKLAIDSCLLHNKSNILIDVMNVTGNIPIFERFRYAQQLANYKAEHAFKKIHKIAVVGKEPIIDKDKFGETVAVNRGVNVKVFTNMIEALAWFDTE